MKWGMVLTPKAKENLKMLVPAYKAAEKFCREYTKIEDCDENCPLCGRGGLLFGNADDWMGDCLVEVLENFTKDFHCDIIDENGDIIKDTPEDEDEEE